MNEKKKTTFGEFSKAFFNKRKTLVIARELSPSSFRSDEIRFGKIEPQLGALPLRQVTSKVCDTFLDKLILCGKSPATRNRYRALLHTYFRYAITSGECKQNPITPIPIFSERLKTRKTNYWHTIEEVDRYVVGAFGYSQPIGLVAALLGFGGCRISEALALSWEDVRWKCGFIRIHRLVESHTNTIHERTKGQRAGGEYQLLLSPKLKSILTRHKKTEGLIVAHPCGRNFNYDAFNKAHHRIIEKVGLKRITPHDLRRTFATHAERAGFHRSEVGELLGHETLKATEAYIEADFSHLILKAKRIGFGKRKPKKT